MNLSLKKTAFFTLVTKILCTYRILVKYLISVKKKAKRVVFEKRLEKLGFFFRFENQKTRVGSMYTGRINRNGPSFLLMDPFSRGPLERERLTWLFNSFLPV